MSSRIRAIARSGRRNAGALLTLALAACAGGSNSVTTPPVPQPPATTLAPAPTPTPDPALATCNPLPRKEWMVGFGIKVQPGLGTNNRKVLNGSPLVKNREYCLATGQVPGGNEKDVCETREETDPQRFACDLYLAGVALDTGRPGPTWYWNGKLCDGEGCLNNPDNQFLAYALGTAGRWEACGGTGSNGSCGACVLDSGTGRCHKD